MVTVGHGSVMKQLRPGANRVHSQQKKLEVAGKDLLGASEGVYPICS